VAGGPPSADMSGPETSTAVELLDNSILSRPSSSFDSQSPAGSATTVVSHAWTGTSSNESTQFPQKNDSMNDENGAKVHVKVTALTDTSIFTIFFKQLSARVVETRHALAPYLHVAASVGH
jgi:hypothetical protein